MRMMMKINSSRAVQLKKKKVVVMVALMTMKKLSLPLWDTI